MPAQFFNEIILIIIAAFLGGFVARTLRLPPILGYIGSGIIFGIIGKNLFESYDSLLKLSEVGVSLLLFTLGFEISVNTLKKINKKIFLLGIWLVATTTIVFYLTLLLFGLDISTALLFSILFSFSSTAIVAKILEEKNLLINFPGNNAFIFLLIQDLLAIPVIFILPILFSESVFMVNFFQSFALSSLKSLLIIAAILFFNRFFLARLLNILFKYPSHELTILATIFVATTTIWLLQYSGLPQPLAAFLAGILISQRGQNLSVLSEIRPLRDIFLVLFFVTTGLLIDYNYLVSHLGKIVIIASTLLVLKFFFIYSALRNASYSHNSSLIIASLLSNIGEFSIVIGQTAYLKGFISEGSYNTLLSTFIISLIFIPFNSVLLRIIDKLKNVGILNFEKDTDYSIARRFSRNNLSAHVILCGHGRVGASVRRILDASQIQYLVVDFDKNEISKLSQQNKKAIYGDPTDYLVLESAGIKKASVLIITIPDNISQKKTISEAKRLNQDLIIICRTQKEDQKAELNSLGVHVTITPEVEAGLKIGTDVLRIFGFGKKQINSLLSEIRKAENSF